MNTANANMGWGIRTGGAAWLANPRAGDAANIYWLNTGDSDYWGVA